VGYLRCTTTRLAGVARGRSFFFILLLFPRIFDERRRRLYIPQSSYLTISAFGVFTVEKRASCNIKIMGQDCQKRSRGSYCQQVMRAHWRLGGHCFSYPFSLPLPPWLLSCCDWLRPLPVLGIRGRLISVVFVTIRLVCRFSPSALPLIGGNNLGFFNCFLSISLDVTKTIEMRCVTVILLIKVALPVDAFALLLQ
jgi:hypothetical protein